MALSSGRNRQGYNADRPHITTRSVLRYSMMPEILPRLRRLGMNLGHFAYLLALIFSSARLLKPGHPMLNPANIGRFGIRQVIAAAANNLTMSKDNIDQIAIFFAIVLGLIMTILQVGVIFFMVMFGQHAEAAVPTTFFTTPEPNDDIVLTFLQQVVGLNNFYNDKAQIGFSIAGAFHQMLAFYSMAMMIIAVIIILYYVFVVVGESARTGSPFGQRFNGLYAPIRLVLALGLLVPLGSGLNAAQYIVLYTAKFGSGLATQAWNVFTDKLVKDGAKLTIPPIGGGMTDMGRNIFLFESCTAAYNIIESGSPTGTMQLRIFLHEYPDGNPTQETVREIATGSISSEAFTNPGYMLFSWTTNGAPAAHTAGLSNLEDCGSLTINVPSASSDNALRELTPQIVKIYGSETVGLAERIRPLATQVAQRYGNMGTGTEPMPTPAQLLQEIVTADTNIQKAIQALPYQKTILDSVFDANNFKNGWGKAAVLYIRIAFANQRFYEAVKATAPRPQIQSSAEQQVQGNIDQNNPWYWFNNDTATDQALVIRRVVQLAQEEIAAQVDSTREPRVADRKYLSKTWEDDGPVTGFLKKVFTISEIQDLADPNTNDIFPMVKLTKLGAALVDKAFWAFGVGLATGAALSWLASGLASAVTSLIFTLGMVGIGIGFLYLYIVPMMPFIYFFFAIVEWGMGVMEGLISAPLWALGHLRIEGDGLPGPGANAGYFILFGMLIRPILILFGLLASYVLFNSGAYMLNLVFGAVVFGIRDGTSLGSFMVDDPGPFGIVAYLIVYTIIIYNLGMVSFKMIDQIPAQSMRWMGQSNMQYQDGKPDPIGNLSGATTAAGTIIGGQIAGGVSGLATGAGAGMAGSKWAQNMPFNGVARKQREAAEEARAASRANNEHLAGLMRGPGGDGGPPPTSSTPGGPSAS